MDLQLFWEHLEDEVIALAEDLASGSYSHGPYSCFPVYEPKKREISKASVRDRLVHHMVYNALRPSFDHYFIHTSLSCRVGKGVHVGINMLRSMARHVSKNNTKPCWGLKLDVKRFFDNIDHAILKKQIHRHVKCPRTLQLIEHIIDSFCIAKAPRAHGLPLGNVTSQLFANLYLHEFDLFIKHTLRQRHYIRYCDDFIILENNRTLLAGLIQPIKDFLAMELKLTLHPEKIVLRKLDWGLDFVGYVQLPHHRVVRTATKRRMLSQLTLRQKAYHKGEISFETMQQSLASYQAMLQHANGHGLSMLLGNVFVV
jgi:retron-type reverse transcriptase